MRILFTWELGAGRGHIAPHTALLSELKKRGHEVSLAVRDPALARRVIGRLPVPIWQAPVVTQRVLAPHRETPTFAHVLHNAGLADVQGTLARLEAWDLLLETTAPDLILSDYSPTLLLGLRGRSIPKALLGTGFFIPPKDKPLSVFWPLSDSFPTNTFAAEESLLQALNRVLDRRETPLLTRVSSLFHEDSMPCLLSHPELEHYPERENTSYLGVSKSPGAALPQWPQGEGPRVFAYLKPSPAVPALLAELSKRGWPTLIACDGLSPEITRGLSSSVCFVAPDLDLTKVGEQSDLAICNANHDTCTQMLFAGTPLLLLPLAVEQLIVAATLVKNGLGLSVNPKTGHNLDTALDQLTQEKRFSEVAQNFAQRRVALRPEGQVERVLERLSHLVSGLADRVS